MAYAALDDITTLYSEDALYVADRDGDGVADVAAVERALDMASGEIDSYLGVRHSLPLDEPFDPILTQFAVDIAIYRLALARDVLSDEHRRRYEDTIKHLTKISEGKAAIKLPASSDPETGEAESTAPRPIVMGGPERMFTREKMRDI
ncbi:MAG: DUF1320 domain-containing protein [Pseudopelagicola sp.]|nr:DUF1320 domain-containing protein [Pseudopelagicola sp.]